PALLRSASEARHTAPVARPDPAPEAPCGPPSHSRSTATRPERRGPPAPSIAAIFSPDAGVPPPPPALAPRPPRNRPPAASRRYHPPGTPPPPDARPDAPAMPPRSLPVRSALHGSSPDCPPGRLIPDCRQPDAAHGLRSDT